jgi:soluble lytic murein transglycosylase-like protein
MRKQKDIISKKISAPLVALGLITSLFLFQGRPVEQLPLDEPDITASEVSITEPLDDLALEARMLFAREQNIKRLRTNYKVSPQQYAGLVEFISGVIAVYYPNETNPGVIAKHIVEISAEENISPIYIASLIAVESSFKQHAKSNVGALGLMQIMPNTAKIVARTKTISSTTIIDPNTNIRLGIRYLKTLERSYRGNRYLALSAYNWGPGNIDKSRRAGSAIPRSVSNYAEKIITKTAHWEKTFKNASEHAATLSML